ncbi:hypothetical protein ACIPSA_24170 [Streptomyces sp. NPDC086549]|uniref:hypothetical protein n=1 Tax=Streptomyces sp. NPDC086549 TaxID=3365752 RepID=UPI003818E444
MTLTPLGGTGDAGGTGGAGANSPGAPRTSESAVPESSASVGGPDSPSPAGKPADHGGTPGRPASTGPVPTAPAPTRTAPPAPAALTWEAPAREATDKRWCEKVTVAFHNSGGTAVRSGTVTFGTHIIGALGIDWATIESTEDLPAPIGADAGMTKTWTVCVDAWRVPLGMHIETRDVTVQWK